MSLLALAGILLPAGFSPASVMAARGPLGAYVPARVVRVHDGDTQTFEILKTGRTYKVRVVGIDTPEVPPARTECDGPKAASAARHVLYPGRPVYLRVDRHAGTTDRYGRQLRVVYLTKTRTWERWLLTRGLANVYDFDHERLALLSPWLAQRNAALGSRVGAWKACPGPSGHGPSTDIYRGWATGKAQRPTNDGGFISMG
jgi:endonuclease YncB( thermonuclease family)